MEKRIEKESILQSHRSPVETLTSLERLELWQKAAEQTGYNIRIIGREGEWFTTPAVPDKIEALDDLRGIYRPSYVQISKGNVRVAIFKPAKDRDYQPFWDIVDALTQEQKESSK